MDSLANFLDLANHHAHATEEDIKKICTDVATNGFHAAFVNPCYIQLAKEKLKDRFPELKEPQFRESTVPHAKVGTVISFPLGGDTIAAKRAAANEAVMLGADELDVVPNIGVFIEGNTDGFLSEMTAIVESARMAGKPVIVKFIIEVGYLISDENNTMLDSPDAKRLAEAACLVQKAGADYVKIGSGMGPRGPTLTDYTIVRNAVGKEMKIKVAGGITTYEQAKPFIDAGVTRIGTSHAVEILSGHQ